MKLTADHAIVLVALADLIAEEEGGYTENSPAIYNLGYPATKWRQDVACEAAPYWVTREIEEVLDECVELHAPDLIDSGLLRVIYPLNSEHEHLSIATLTEQGRAELARIQAKGADVELALIIGDE